MWRSNQLVALLVVLSFTAGCRAIEGIFKLGFWAGIIAAAIVVAIVIAVARALSR